MTTTVFVGHKAGDLFEVTVGGHRLYVDQPFEAGGSGLAPAPTEIFVAGLASCVAYYARRFLVRHGLPEDGLALSAEFELAERPARVGSIKIVLYLPDGVPAERRAGLLAVASHCTVHNSLKQPPEVNIELDVR